MSPIPLLIAAAMFVAIIIAAFFVGRLTGLDDARRDAENDERVGGTD